MCVLYKLYNLYLYMIYLRYIMYYMAPCWYLWLQSACLSALSSPVWLSEISEITVQSPDGGTRFATHSSSSSVQSVCQPAGTHNKATLPSHAANTFFLVARATLDITDNGHSVSNYISRCYTIDIREARGVIASLNSGIRSAWPEGTHSSLIPSGSWMTR